MTVRGEVPGMLMYCNNETTRRRDDDLTFTMLGTVMYIIALACVARYPYNHQYIQTI